MSKSANSLAFQAAGPQNAAANVFPHGGWMWEPVIGHLPEYRGLTPGHLARTMRAWIEDQPLPEEIGSL